MRLINKPMRLYICLIISAKRRHHFSANGATL